jgi:predicted ester cyclase
MIRTNKQLINDYYEMWNTAGFDKADSLLSPQIRFRGSLGIATEGIEGFVAYAKMILHAFLNLYHAAEIVVSEGSQAAVYVSYTGTHRGKLFDFEPTQNRISYSGASFFQFKDGKITDIKVLGDLHTLYGQIGRA